MTAGEHRTKSEKRSIPEFKSREEEAQFWDTHSAADYWQESQPVKVRFARNLSEGITIRLDPETMREVREQARQKGLGPTTLIRMWVLERLHGVRSPAP